MINATTSRHLHAEPTPGSRKSTLARKLRGVMMTGTAMVVGATLFIAGKLVFGEEGGTGAAFLLLSNAFFMIVTAYYQRTNHTRTGGVEKSHEGR